MARVMWIRQEQTIRYKSDGNDGSEQARNIIESMNSVVITVKL